MTERHIYIHTGPMWTKYYTGIPNVNREVCRFFRQHSPNSVSFFHRDYIIRPEIADELIDYGLTSHVKRTLKSGQYRQTALTHALSDSDKTHIGIFVDTIKGMRRAFDYEVQIVHDLSWMLSPELHLAKVAERIARNIELDIQTSDLCVCISQATQSDLTLYLDYPVSRTLVSHLGFTIPDLVPSDKASDPFILILGTIEPRKNIPMLLRYLEQHSNVLAQYRFIFAGRVGWGEAFEKSMQAVDIPVHLKSRIEHLGYTPQATVKQLLQQASMLVFPSIYEGFGLPVVEAMAYGCPVISSVSASLPEAGGDLPFYFDPMNIESFHQAFSEAEHTLKTDLPLLQEKMRLHCSQFTWDAFNQRILNRIEQDLNAAALAC